MGQADKNDINLEKKKLTRNLAVVQKELEESRILCEKRRYALNDLFDVICKRNDPSCVYIEQFHLLRHKHHVCVSSLCAT